MSDPRLTRTPVDFVFVDDNGNDAKTIETKSFTDNDFIHYDQWLRQQFVKRSMDAFSVLPQSQRSDLEVNMIAQAASIHLFDRGSGSKMFASIPGLAKAIHLMTDGTSITESEIRNYLMIKQNRNEASKHWQSMNIGSTTPGEPELDKESTG